MPRIWTVTIGDPKSVKEFGDKFRELENGNWVFEVKKNRPIRSLSHNRYYWALLTIISTYSGEFDRDTLHEVCKNKFNGKMINLPKGGSERVGQSTSNMDKSEFSAYINRVKAFAHNEFGLIIPEREDMTTELWLSIENNYEENFKG